MAAIGNTERYSDRYTAKRGWGVSLKALVYRAHSLNLHSK